jgi:hypothetical protein
MLQQLEKKETQTLEDFSDDIRVLEELWLEKLVDAELY